MAGLGPADVTTQIVITDGKGYINGIPPEVNDDLVRLCAYKPLNVEYTVRYDKQMAAGAVLPGYEKLLKNSQFPPGLLHLITTFLDRRKVEYDVQNNDRPGDKPKLTITLEGIESRPYQDEAVEACLLNRRGVVQAPTGSGKTAIGARVLETKAAHALIVVPTIDLLYQYKRFLEEHMTVRDPRHAVPMKMPIGQLGDGVVNPQPITIATVRTAAKLVGHAYESYEWGEYDDKDDTTLRISELREWVDAITTLLIDECHILGADTVYELCRRIPAINYYGFSASPWRDDGADLKIEGATGHKIYRIGTKDLVDDGWLVPPIIQTVNTVSWFSGGAWGKICKRCSRQVITWKQECDHCHGHEFKSQFTDCYRVEIVENVKRNAMIAADVHKLNVPTLVLVKQVKHGRNLAAMIEGAVFLSGRDKSGVRSQAFDDIRSGKSRVLVATTIADMGLDLPILGALVLAGGGKSSTRHLQRIGRVVRPYPGKHTARVIDYDDSHVHQWFKSHFNARRKIEHAEWDDVALWI